MNIRIREPLYHLIGPRSIDFEREGNGRRHEARVFSALAKLPEISYNGKIFRRDPDFPQFNEDLVRFNEVGEE